MGVCFTCMLSICKPTHKGLYFHTGLQKLLFLELRENHLKSVPYCFHSLPKLKELYTDDGVIHEDV
jgi:hypothetical protein